MTVDTGAERTIVHLDVVGGEELGDNLRQLCGVTGYCMPLWGPINITIGPGGKQVNWPVYVPEVQDKCLLGLDLLRAVGALIDLKRRILTVCGEEVPLLYTEDLAEVVVTREVTLPPCSETRVECHLSRVMKGSTGMVEAAEVAEDVMVARGVIPRNKIRVLMANFSEEQRTIHAGTKVGVCEEISGEVEIIEERQEGGQRGGQRMAAPGRSVPAHLVDLARRSMKCLSADQRGKMKEMLCCYADVFSKDDLDLGKTDLVKHHIDTGDAVPIKHAPQRIPPLKRAEITAEVRKLHRQGLIEPSESPWSSAVVLVRKPDGGRRLCVGYRRLNDVTIKDSYPLPRIDDTLDALMGAKWFSTLDLKSGYHQVEMEEADKLKTAFSCGQVLWHFRVMPFGLCDAPSCFERLMERVLEGLQWRTALVYLDDIIIFAHNFEEELQRLEEVLRRFRNAGLKLHPKVSIVPA